jgi:methionine-rich copper-binding protein CopC
MQERLKKFGIGAFILAALFSVPRLALAHAILVASTPAIHGTVRGPVVAVDLKFNSRVDSIRSRIFLVLPNGATQVVSLEKQAAPERLLGHAQLKPGSYSLRWQALASDGHITRGEIPFTVQ